jgi:RHS repeat-associated protein
VDTFTYNGDGQRVQKQDSTGTNNHVWDGQNMLLETNASDVIQVVYALEPVLYGNLISQSRGGVDSFYLFDALGSVRQLANVSGSVTDSYLYDSFGNIMALAGSSVNPFTYLGRVGYYSDPDLSTYSLRARVYNPVLGRFIARDPIFVAGRSLYLYAENQPVTGVDPSGALTIKSIPPAAIGQRPCGTELKMSWSYTFRKSEAHPCNGYMVQKLTNFCRKVTCFPVGVVQDNEPVWEAYPSSTGGSVTDTETCSCVHTKSGLHTTKAEVRLYCDYVLEGAPDGPSTWQEKPVFGTGICSSLYARATNKPPTFWDDKATYPYRDGPAYRSFVCLYDCCLLGGQGMGYCCFGAGPPLSGATECRMNIWGLVGDWVRMSSRPSARGRAAGGSRLFLNAAGWITRVAAPWQDLPRRFGPWV